METKEVGIGYPRPATHMTIIHGIFFTRDVVAKVLLTWIFNECWKHCWPSLSNNHSNKSEHRGQNIVESQIVIVDQVVGLDVFEDLETDGCVEEEKDADQLDDVATFWQNVNDWVQIRLAPGIL